MKYCTHCGKELLDDAIVCVGCGCATENSNSPSAQIPAENLVNTYATRTKTNGIIWIVIGAVQVALGLTLDWTLLIVAALNIVSSIQDLDFSKKVLQNPVGIVAREKPLTGPIITLAYNLIFGGIIGVAGSIYHLLAVRNYVMQNEAAFLEIEGSPESE